MQFELLQKVDAALKIEDLDEGTLRELQTALLILGYRVRTVDGKLGPRTRTAWAEFKTDVMQDDPDTIGPGSIDTLTKLVERAKGGKHDFTSKAGTIAAIKSTCIGQGLDHPAQIAYVLATVEHETGASFRPVVEAYYVSKEAQRKYLAKKSYSPYYGRGYVQLTWDYNYKKYGQILGVDLLHEPDRALEPEIALFVLVHGFKTGAFTGHRLTEYIDGHRSDFIKARRCINGTDQAEKIAHFAERHLATL